MSSGQHIGINMPSNKNIFLLWGVFILICVFSGILLEQYLIFAVPALVLGAYVCIMDVRLVFWILIASLPLSIELNIGGGSTTDFISEPLMLILLIVGAMLLIQRREDVNLKFLYHPISLLIIALYAWGWIATFFSLQVLVSLKYMLAKTWYLAAFYFVGAWFINDRNGLYKFIKTIWVPLIFVIIYTLARHASFGFSFEKANFMMTPFFRNHVDYASVCMLVVPFLWLMYSRDSITPFYKLFWAGSILLCLTAIYFSFTRVAMLGVVSYLGFYFIIRFKLTRALWFSAFIGAVIFIGYMIRENNYLSYAPNYEKTTSHKQFGNLVEATYKMKDVSTMERVYRWIAGFNMVAQRPFIGYGPNNFYTFYKEYTVTSFKTYVSKNPEQSTVHCYFLLIFAEQGVVAFLIFLALCVIPTLLGEKIYHQASDPRDKKSVLAVLLSFYGILTILLINDMIETDKVGSLFFIYLAFFVNMHLKIKKKALPSPAE